MLFILLNKFRWIMTHHNLHSLNYDWHACPSAGGENLYFRFRNKLRFWIVVVYFDLHL